MPTPPPTAPPMLEAIRGLDTLAILAGIPNPGGTIHLDEEALAGSYPTAEDLEAGAWPADVALRRVAAWANALVAALPTTTQE